MIFKRLLVKNKNGLIYKSISRAIWPITAVVILGLLAWINKFPDGFIFSGGDVTQYFNRSWVERNLHYIWSNNVGEGGFNPIFLYYPFYSFLFFLSDMLNLTPSDESVLYIFIFLGGAFVSCFIGLSILNKNYTEFPSLDRSLLAFIYAVNPYTLYAVYFIWGYSPFLIMYLIFPIIFAASLKLFISSDRNDIFYSLVILFFGHLIATISYGNLSFFVGLNLTIILFISFWALLEPKFNVNKFILKLFFWVAIEICATSWAVIPQLSHILYEGNPIVNNKIFDYKSWILWQKMPFVEIFNLGNQSFRQINTNIVLGIAGVSFFAMGLYACLNNKRNFQYTIAAMASVLLLVIVESKGKGLIPDSFVLLFFNNSLAGAFRSYGKLMIFLPFLIIFSFTFSLVNWSLNARRNLIYIALALNSISAYPIFLGDLQTKFSGAFTNDFDFRNSEWSYLNKIPNEYFAASLSIKKDGLSGKILSAPYSVDVSPGWIRYPSWKHVGTDPTSQIFTLPVIQMNTYGAFGYPYGQIWAEVGRPKEILEICKDLGVSYIIFHKDVARSFIEPSAHKFSQLVRDGHLIEIFYGEKLIVYRIADGFRSQLFTVETENGQSTLFESIKFSKINPTKYTVQIPVNNLTVNLVMRESFSNLWNVYIVKNNTENLSMQYEHWWDSFFLDSIPNNAHFLFHGYGNKWKLNTKELCEKYTCTIDNNNVKKINLLVEYSPQRLVYLFVLVGFFVLTILIASVFYLKFTYYKKIKR